MQKLTVTLMTLIFLAHDNVAAASTKYTDGIPRLDYSKIPGPLAPGTKNWQKHRQLEREYDEKKARQQSIAYEIWLQQWYRQKAEQERNNPQLAYERSRRSRAVEHACVVQ